MQMIVVHFPGYHDALHLWIVNDFRIIEQDVLRIVVCQNLFD